MPSVARQLFPPPPPPFPVRPLTSFDKRTHVVARSSHSFCPSGKNSVLRLKSVGPTRHLWGIPPFRCIIYKSSRFFLIFFICRYQYLRARFTYFLIPRVRAFRPSCRRSGSQYNFCCHIAELVEDVLAISVLDFFFFFSLSLVLSAIGEFKQCPIAFKKSR